MTTTDLQHENPTGAPTVAGENPDPEGEEPPTDPSAEDLRACQDALTEVLAAQSAVHVSQNELAAASRELDALLSELASQPSGDPTTPTDPTPNQSQSLSASGDNGAPRWRRWNGVDLALVRPDRLPASRRCRRGAGRRRRTKL